MITRLLTCHGVRWLVVASVLRHTCAWRVGSARRTVPDSTNHWIGRSVVLIVCDGDNRGAFSWGELITAALCARNIERRMRSRNVCRLGRDSCDICIARNVNNALYRIRFVVDIVVVIDRSYCLIRLIDILDNIVLCIDYCVKRFIKELNCSIETGFDIHQLRYPLCECSIRRRSALA
ncbi:MULTISPECIES: hypothetical protein [unclassified Mycolicibacterium]|uniref:hypothetical protein n=1 Tax=unclassified Mycolicibacterium TaxID=2636767 RepID=UPI002EDA4FBC